MLREKACGKKLTATDRKLIKVKKRLIERTDEYLVKKLVTNNEGG